MQRFLYAIINNSITITFFVFLCLNFSSSFAQPDDGVGQTIQIYTRFHSFVGKPTWLLIIRDVDDGQVIPYLYDIRKGDNFWLAFTYGRNYKITVSEVAFHPYADKISNFCGLQDGVISGDSLYITITGDLTPNRRTYNCQVLRFPDANFTIVKPTAAE